MRHSGSTYLHPRIDSRVVSTNRSQQYSSKKILVAKLAAKCETFLDINGEFAGFNINSLEEISDSYPLEFIFAYTMSDLFNTIYDTLFGALRMQGGYLQFQAPQLRAMLIPNTTEAFRQELAEFVKLNIEGDLSFLQQEIDSRFCVLLEEITSETDPK